MESKELQLCPSVFGLKRVGEPLCPEKGRTDLPILNKRGTPVRERKKNPLFFDSNVYSTVEGLKNKYRKLDESERSASKKKISRISSRSVKRKVQKFCKRSVTQQEVKPKKRRGRSPTRKEGATPAKRHFEERTETTEGHDEIVLKKKKLGKSDNYTPLIQDDGNSAETVDVSKLENKVESFLKSPKARRWAYSEFFYNIVDKPVLMLSDNDFTICLKESFPELKNYNLTRVEWNMVKKLLGRPRRCSEVFYDAERREINRRRALLEVLQRGKVGKLRNAKDIPNQVPLIPMNSSRVAVWFSSPDLGLFPGTVLESDEDNKTYKVEFDDPTITTRYVPENKLAMIEPTAAVPKTEIVDVLRKLSESGKFKFVDKVVRRKPMYVEKAKGEQEVVKGKREQEVQVDEIGGPIPPTGINEEEEIRMLNTPPRAFRIYVKPRPSIATPSSVSKSTNTPAKFYRCASKSASKPFEISPHVRTIKSGCLDKLYGGRQVVSSTRTNSTFEALAKFKMCLDFKKSQLRIIARINRKGEKAVANNTQVSKLLRTKFCKITMSLASANKALARISGELNGHVQKSMSKDALMPVLFPTYLREYSANVASRVVNMQNQLLAVPPKTTVVSDVDMISLIRDLMSILVQLQYVTDREDCLKYEIKTLYESMFFFKSSLALPGFKSFENIASRSIEIATEHLIKRKTNPTLNKPHDFNLTS